MEVCHFHSVPQKRKKTNHKENKLGTVACQVCSKVFFHELSLFQHVKTKHGDVTQHIPPRPSYEGDEIRRQPFISLSDLQAPGRLARIKDSLEALLATTSKGLKLITTASHFRLAEAIMYTAHFLPCGQRLPLMKEIFTDHADPVNFYKARLSLVTSSLTIPHEAFAHLERLVQSPKAGVVLAESFGATSGKHVTSEKRTVSQLVHSLKSDGYFLPNKCSKDYIFAILTGCKRAIKNQVNWANPSRKEGFELKDWLTKTIEPDVVAYLPFYEDNIDRTFFFTMLNTIKSGFIAELRQKSSLPSSFSKGLPDGAQILEGFC